LPAALSERSSEGRSGEWLDSKLASAAGNAFGLEWEGLSPEDRDFEMARRYVRFATHAAKKAAAAIADALKAAADSINGYKARQRAAKETNWARVLDASATVKKLVAEHLETARIITAPARIKGDLNSTAELLRQFVDTGARGR
jgi:hypothetical protein